jgi:uncharacterized repeat protein (TIGR03803 family)
MLKQSHLEEGNLMKNIKAGTLCVLCVHLCLLLSTRAFGQIGEELLYSFSSGNNDAEIPVAVAQGPDGWLYGASSFGGAYGYGALFKINTNGMGYMVIHSFNTNSLTDGDYPTGDIVVTPDGWLCGTTVYGGANNVGTIYKISTNGMNFSLIHSFASHNIDNPDNATEDPENLMQAKDGSLYGIIVGNTGGYGGCVFKLESDAGGYSEIHTFGVNPNGDLNLPTTGLVQGPDGALYGGTFSGYRDVSEAGGIYRVSEDGLVYSVIYTFPGTGGTFPDEPYSAFCIGTNGVLYGTTVYGGSNGLGCVFSVNTNGLGFKQMYAFADLGNHTSLFPKSLIQGRDGELYGTTAYGGSVGVGMAFRIEPSGKSFADIWDFSSGNSPDGENPSSGLTQGVDGHFYGVTANGGKNSGDFLGEGAVYAISLTGFPPQITSTNLPEGTNGLPYEAILNAIDGKSPYTWKIVGSLPKGLVLPTGGNVISGTPTAGGIFNFSIQVTDANKLTATQAISLTIYIKDITPPTISITSPKTGFKTNLDMVTILGTASDNFAVSNVQVSVNSGSWAKAVQVIGWSNWSYTALLVPGTNNISAIAVDTSGNISATNPIKVVYILSAPIEVGINGEGSIKTDYNSQELVIGQTYFMTAKAAKGFAFVKWTDGGNTTVTNGTTVKFMMESNLVLVAVFVDVTKPTLKVTSPRTNAKITGTTVNVTGTAADNVGVAHVYYQINGGGWLAATSSNSYTNWTAANVPLTSGANTLLVYATDAAGNISTTTSVKVTDTP